MFDGPGASLSVKSFKLLGGGVLICETQRFKVKDLAIMMIPLLLLLLPPLSSFPPPGLELYSLGSLGLLVSDNLSCQNLLLLLLNNTVASAKATVP